VGKTNLLGTAMTVSFEQMNWLKNLARANVRANERIARIKREMAAVQREIDEVKKNRDEWKEAYQSLYAEVKEFISAIRKFPARLREFVTELFRPECERKQALELAREQQIEQQPTKKKSHDRGR
jgi:uncharacterized coiled-coil DUF342 family protein